MASYGSTRAWEVAQRRVEREAQRRSREIERRRKEDAKLSAQEAARLEVEAYEAQLAVLLSLHKTEPSHWDWAALASALAPHSPQRMRRQELIARRRACLSNTTEPEVTANGIDEAIALDERHFREAEEWYRQQYAEWKRMSTLAHRVMAGDGSAYIEALTELSQLNEVGNLGSSLHWIARGPHLIECCLKVHGIQAIPRETKSLTSSGKLSAKPMAQARFHELYQDYVCSCVLRIGREAFALLPIETLLVTASVESTDSRTGHPVEQPVLSVALDRKALERLDFEHLDPSNAIEAFFHRGDFKATRKTGAFAPITPIAPTDLPQPMCRVQTANELLCAVRVLRDEFNTANAELHGRLGQQEAADLSTT